MDGVEAGLVVEDMALGIVGRVRGDKPVSPQLEDPDRAFEIASVEPVLGEMVAKVLVRVTQYRRIQRG